MVVTNDQPLPPFVDNFIQSGARKRAHRGGYKALLWKAQNVHWWGWLGKPVQAADHHKHDPRLPGLLDEWFCACLPGRLGGVAGPAGCR